VSISLTVSSIAIFLQRVGNFVTHIIGKLYPHCYEHEGLARAEPQWTSLDTKIRQLADNKQVAACEEVPGE
jgi:hypothetical protein